MSGETGPKLLGDALAEIGRGAADVKVGQGFAQNLGYTVSQLVRSPIDLLSLLSLLLLQSKVLKKVLQDGWPENRYAVTMSLYYSDTY
jgi:hypothetical protein